MTSTALIAPLASLHPPDTELVLGVVAAVGTDLDHFERLLTDLLNKFRYKVEPVRLTDFFKKLDLAKAGFPTDDSDPCTQIRLRQKAGNYLREEAGRGDVLVLHAADAIHEKRKARTVASEHKCVAEEIRGQEIAALDRTAYVLRQLKHVDEVDTLRRVYGHGFFLIGLYSTKSSRSEYLTKQKNGNADLVAELMDRDEREEDKFGQKMRDTFALADVFIRADSSNVNKTRDELERFLRLVFADPYVTPTPDEQAMYLAFATSLRSADLSRQVGAVITNDRGDVLGVGANDVPRAGGGQYGPGTDDKRDHVRGADANEIQRNKIVVEIMRHFDRTKKTDDELLKEGDALLADTRVRELIEFSRAVHAEMDALMACVRVGSSVRGGTLYCTTFPCHICAKHIVDAGIFRVVYIEPYAKSLAHELHGDAIAIEEDAELLKGRWDEARSAGIAHARPERVIFEPFIGVGPRHYPALFAIKLGNGYPVKRKSGGKTISWSHAGASLRVPNVPFSYVDREVYAIAALQPKQGS